jgi:hypothetical protein
MVTTEFFFINVVEKGESSECPTVKHARVEIGPDPAHASSIIPIDPSQI